MEIIQIIGVGFCGLIIISILKEYKPEFKIYISLVVGIIIFFMVADNLINSLNLIIKLSNKLKINNTYISVLLKITGISILTEFAVSICKDSGESAIADKVNFGRQNSSNWNIDSNYFSIDGYIIKPFMKE